MFLFKLGAQNNLKAYELDAFNLGAHLALNASYCPSLQVGWLFDSMSKPFECRGRLQQPLYHPPLPLLTSTSREPLSRACLRRPQADYRCRRGEPSRRLPRLLGTRRDRHCQPLRTGH